MNQPTRLIRVAVPALLLAAVAIAPAQASAAGAEHLFVPEEYDGTQHVAADENPCGPWATTLHEIRHGGFDVTVAPGGQVPGEVHINGVVDGWLQLTPDDPSLPTYTGTYREKDDAIITDLDGDVARVAQYRLRVPMSGTDGSRLVIVLRGKLTVDGTGRVVVSRDAATCG